MSELLEKIVCDCALRVLGPLNEPADAGVLALSVRQTIEAESPIHLPDDARRLAEALSTSLKMNGLARPLDALADPLAELLEGNAYRLDIGLAQTIGVGVSRMEVELMLSMLQERLLQIDARNAATCPFEANSRACERELVVRLKNSIAECKRRYLKD